MNEQPVPDAPLRTGGAPDYPGGRIHTPDPAAVERLKRLMAEDRERRAEQALQSGAAGSAPRRGDKYIVANLIRRSAELSLARLPGEEQLRKLNERHVAGEPAAKLAKEIGISGARLCAVWRKMGLWVAPAGQHGRANMGGQGHEETTHG